MTNVIRLAVLPFLFTVFAGAAARQSEIHYAGNTSPASITPTFDNGYLAVYDRRGDLLVYGPDGSLAFSYSPPENSYVSNAAVDVDGSAAVAVAGDQHMNGRISLLTPSGKQLRLIEMENYIPAGVCFAPDHSIWVIGGPFEPESSTSNYEILRHYSVEGEELGRYLPRSSFPAGRQPLHVVIGHWMLRITEGRIGVFLNHGEQAFWVETDMMGKKTGRWPVDPNYHVGAFSGGAVYAETASGLVKLDRQSGQWRIASNPGAAHLLGAYRGDLVFMPRGENSITFVTPGP